MCGISNAERTVKFAIHFHQVRFSVTAAAGHEMMNGK
jgi:hypothetical protein